MNNLQICIKNILRISTQNAFSIKKVFINMNFDSNMNQVRF